MKPVRVGILTIVTFLWLPLAHAQEQAQSGRLIRPRSHYVGPLPREAA